MERLLTQVSNRESRELKIQWLRGVTGAVLLARYRDRTMGVLGSRAETAQCLVCGTWHCNRAVGDLESWG